LCDFLKNACFPKNRAIFLLSCGRGLTVRKFYEKICDLKFHFPSSCLIVSIKLLGAIQIIREKFLAYFRPPPPYVIWWHLPGVTWQFSFIRKHSFLKTFVLKFSSKMDKKLHETFWLTPRPPLECHVLFEWPLNQTKDCSTLYVCILQYLIVLLFNHQWMQREQIFFKFAVIYKLKNVLLIFLIHQGFD